MRKKILILLSIVSMLFVCHTESFAAPGSPIPFNTGYVNPTEPGSHNPKSPVLAPTVYIEGNVLTFETPCDGCVLQLVDENDDVVYTTIIPAGTTSLILPSTLEGTYELQIIRDNWLFYADINL